MGKQWVIDAVKGLRPERVPWVPYVGVHGAYLVGKKAPEFLQSADLIYQAIVKATEEYQADGIPILFDLNVEAIAMGCEGKWTEENPQQVISHPLLECTLDNIDEEIAKLPIPGPNDGRWPIIIEAGKRAKEALPDTALYGIFCGPLTLGAHMRGAKMFTDLVKNPEIAHKIMALCAKVCTESARIYAEDIGADVIAITDPVASQISPKAFREYVTPPCQGAIEVAKKFGKVSSFFICGDATKVMEEVCQVGTDGFAIDEQLCLNYIRDLALRYGVGFGGNLKLTLALSLGILDPREDAIVSLAAGGHIGFVFAPG
jgi:uroporphyrinogen decarboxylase